MIKKSKIEKPMMERGSVSTPCLKENVEAAMEIYFKDLDGYQTKDLYALFLEQVEKPFFTIVMKYKKGNITHAAQMLGINRATLCARLKKYGIACK